MKEVEAVLAGFGEGWRLRLLFKTPRGDFYLSIMETTEEIWNGLEGTLDWVGRLCKIRVEGYKVTKIELAD